MILKLTDTFFRNTFLVNKKKNKQPNPYLSICLLGLIFACISGGLTAAYYCSMGKGQPPHEIVIIVMVCISLLTIVMSFFSMHSTLFHTKDFDNLAALPLKTNTIVISKFFSVFLYDFIIDVIAMIPVLVLYMVFGGSGIGLFIGIVGTLLLDFVPLCFVTLIAVLVCVITAKSKHSTLFSVLLYSVLFIALMVVVVLATNSTDALKSIPNALPYFQFLTKAYKGDLLSLLWFVLISLGGVAIAIFLSILLYVPVNQMKVNVAAKEYTLGQNKTPSGLGKLLFKKEMDLVLHTPLFVLSTYLLPVISLVMGIIFYGFVLKGFSGTPEEGVKAVTLTFRLIYLVFVFIFGAICATTFASFSLEGENFKMLFAYPISKKEIIKAKIKSSIIPLSILFIVSGLIMLLVGGISQGFQNITYSMWIGNLLLPVLVVSVASLIGTLCGLRYIKLDYANPNDIFKKSKAYGFFCLYSAIVNLVGLGIYWVLLGIISKNKDPLTDLAVIGIVTVYYLIAIFISAYFVHTKGEELFNKAIQ